MLKRIVSALLCALLLTVCCACSGAESEVILDNSENSSFTDFYTENGRVYIECVLNLYNTSDGERNVRITAIDNEDVKIGLLKSPELKGLTENGGDVFTLKSGENKVTVLFSGDFAGIYQITRREIPRFISIKDA